MTIVTLWQQGKSQREISKLVNHDRRTVGKVIKNYQKTKIFKVPAIQKVKILDQYQEKILEYLENDLSGVRITEELAKLGCSAKYRTVSEYIQKLKKKEKICIRFHTQPGEEAQVDFGYVGLLPDEDGRIRKSWIFNMRLSYSRLDYYQIVFDQKVDTFIKCHISAFRYFGGVPEIVKIDNLKSAILHSNFYDPTYQALYKSFSEHYKFNILPCRVRKPQEKGKVEAGIKYIKNNFFRGRKFSTNKEMISAKNEWQDNKCNKRVHGTTRKVPREVFEEKEKRSLIQLPVQDFTLPQIIRRKVYKDCHVTFDYNYYSVPFEYAGKSVDIICDDKLIKINHSFKEIAVHVRRHTRGEFITNGSHYPEYKNYNSIKWREKYQVKMEEIGINTSKLYKLILEQQPHTWYRTTLGILNLKKTYSAKIVEQACFRALSFNVTSYSKIKNICSSGSYNLPNEIYRG